MPITRVPYGVIDGRYINAEGDTMLGPLTLSGAPSADLHASTKKYVDDGLVLKANDADVLKKDGSVALTSDWDIGDGRMIQADKIQARDGAGLSLFEDGDTGIFVKDGGNVGIGMTDPIAKLDVVHSGGNPSGTPLFTVRFCQGAGSPGFIFERTDVGKFISFWTGTTGAILGFASELSSLDIGTYTYANRYSANFPSPRYITLSTANQSVGVFTSAPGRKLDVLDATYPQLRLTHTADSIYTDFQTDGNGDLTITPSGNELILPASKTLAARTGRTTALVVAGNDSSTLGKAQADYICNGTDDQVEIQAAINEVISNGGGKVVLLDGAFHISGSITIAQGSSNIHIAGMGHSVTTILLDNSSDVDMLIIGGAGDDTLNITLSGIKFDGNRTSQTASVECVSAVRIENLLVRGCKFESAKGSGLSLSTVSYSAIVNSLSVGCGDNGLAIIDGSDYITILENIIRDMDEWGIIIEDTCSNVIVASNQFYNNTLGHVSDGASNMVRNNTGHLTENSGTAIVSPGNTYTDVSHNLSITPSINDIHVTPTSSLGNASKYYISDINASTFRINLDTDPGEINATFVWQIGSYHVEPGPAAGEYYVDYTNGNDTNDGSIGSPIKYHPWMSDYSGSVTLQPGDTVYMKRGEQWVKSNPTAPWMTVASSGSPGAYITTTAYSTGNKPLIKIDTDTDYNVIYAEGKSYIEFDNLHIQHHSGQDYGPNVQDGIHFRESGGVVPHHWVITNCEIDNIPGVGIQGFDNSHDIIIGDTSANQTATDTEYSNHIHDFGYAGVLLAGVNPDNDQSHFYVYYNYIHDGTRPTCGNNEYGIAFTARLNYSDAWPAYAFARYNYVKNIKTWEALDTHGGSYIYFQDNYIYHCYIGIELVKSHLDGITDRGDHYYAERNIIEQPVDPDCPGGAFIDVLGLNASGKASYVYIKENELFHTTRPTDVNTGTGINIKFAENVEIEGNEIYNNSTLVGGDSAIYLSYDADSFGDITIRRNYIHDWTYYGIDLRAAGMAGPAHIYSNIMEGITAPIAIRGDSESIDEDILIYNNALQGTNFGVITDNSMTLADGARLTVRNNIISYENVGSYTYLYLRITVSGILVIDNNLYYNSNSSTPFYLTATAYNWTDWQTAGYDNNGHGPSVDPIYTNGSGSFLLDTDFQLDSESPCIDSGVDMGLSVDYGGNTIAGIPDIGAYEYIP